MRKISSAELQCKSQRCQLMVFKIQLFSFLQNIRSPHKFDFTLLL